MKQYRNAARTKKWIRQAFTELIAEKKSISKVTVSELAQRADITKTTFYYHYPDIYAVAEEIENELIQTLSDVLDRIEKDAPNDYEEYIQSVLMFIKENESTYRMAVNTSELGFFISKLKNIFSKRMIKEAVSWGFSPDIDKRTVQVCFLTSACVDTVVAYLKGELPPDINIVCEIITDAIGKLKG